MYPDVEGYGVVSEGEVYHPTAFTDPAKDFKYAGDPDKQAEYQEAEGTVKDFSPPEITDEQSNASEATSKVDVDGELISTKKPVVDVTPEGMDNNLTEGPTGVVTDSSQVTEGGVRFPDANDGTDPEPDSTVTESDDTKVEFS